MTHEIGHSFGGNHRNYYAENSLYTCDAAVGDETRRSAHSSNGHAVYKYLSDDLQITQCASASILNSMANFACMWEENKSPIMGNLTVYTVCSTSFLPFFPVPAPFPSFIPLCSPSVPLFLAFPHPSHFFFCSFLLIFLLIFAHFLIHFFVCRI